LDYLDGPDPNVWNLSGLNLAQYVRHVVLVIISQRVGNKFYTG
jgi:hypothetical protein